jgi:hypothetical protein
VEGDARKAENYFFKINQQAAPIDPAHSVYVLVNSPFQMILMNRYQRKS